MKNYYVFILLLCLAGSGSQSCKNSRAFDKNPGREPACPASEHLVMSVLYQQQAAEYRALCYQSFNLARLRVDERLRVMGLSMKYAVVVDIDETVLDNSPHEAKCIINNTLYPDYWQEWVEEASARAVPGSREFLEYVNSKKIEVFYISNRSEKYREPTLLNLQKVGFPNADSVHLLLKTGEQGKKGRRDLVSETHNIILLIGDNLNDFSEQFENLPIEERFAATDRMKESFGARFIVLPNAMYGDWEAALYNYNYSLPEMEKSTLRRKFLVTF